MRFSGFALGAAALAAAVIVQCGAPASATPATPLSLLKSTASQSSIVEKTHGWHRRCRHGFTDVHRHIPGVGRGHVQHAKVLDKQVGRAPLPLVLN